MTEQHGPRRFYLRLISAALSLLAFPVAAFAQLDGPRIYWPLPVNTNIVSGTHITGSANAAISVFDRVQGSIDIDSEINVLGYLRSQSVFGRTAHWQATSAPVPARFAVAPDAHFRFANDFGRFPRLFNDEPRSRAAAICQRLLRVRVVADGRCC